MSATNMKPEVAQDFKLNELQVKANENLNQQKMLQTDIETLENSNKQYTYMEVKYDNNIWDSAPYNKYTCANTKVVGYCIIPESEGERVCSLDDKCKGYLKFPKNNPNQGNVQLLTDEPVNNQFSGVNIFYKKVPSYTNDVKMLIDNKKMQLKDLIRQYTDIMRNIDNLRNVYTVNNKVIDSQDKLITVNNEKITMMSNEIQLLKRDIEDKENEYQTKNNKIFILKNVFILIVISVLLMFLVKNGYITIGVAYGILTLIAVILVIMYIRANN